MATCPACKTEQTRRVDGRCPHCGAKVKAFGGRWYRDDGNGGPTTIILRHFEERVSKSISDGEGRQVSFAIPRKGMRYRRELVTAERLLELSRGELDLVKETIDLLFHHKRFNWKTRDSLMAIERDYPLALALVEARRKEEDWRKRKEQQSLAALAVSEDVFS